MKGGAPLALLLGVFLGLGVGFVLFSTGPDVEALDARVEVETTGTPDDGPDAPAAAPEVADSATATSDRGAERTAEPSVGASMTTGRTGPAGEGVIEGDVTDEDGAPVAGVVVRLERVKKRTLSERENGRELDNRTLDEALDVAAKAWADGQASRYEARTDASGHYRIEDLPKERFSIDAWADGCVVEARSAGTRGVRPGDVVNFKVRRLVELPIRITRPGGGPIDRAMLHEVATVGGRNTSKKVSWRRSSPDLLFAPGSYDLKAGVDRELAEELGIPEMTSDQQSVHLDVGDRPSAVAFELRPQLGVRGRVLLPDDQRLDQARALILPAPSTGDVDLATLGESDENAWLGSWKLDYEFLDLEAGRYVVGIALDWNSPAIAHGFVDVTDGVARLDIQMPTVDESDGLKVRLVNHAGAPVAAHAFSYMVRQQHTSRSNHTEGRSIGPGEYQIDNAGLLEALKEPRPDGVTVSLTVHTRSIGEKTIEIPPGRRELEIVFREPAKVVVGVPGLLGSGFEGKLYVKLTAKGSGSAMVFSTSAQETVGAAGTAELGPVEAGSHALELWVKDRQEGYWRDRKISGTEVRLGPGDNTATLAMPPLYTLTVHVGEAKGDLRLSASNLSLHVGGPVSTNPVVFEMLPAGDYQLQRWGSGADGTMSLSIPAQAEVTFAPSKKNALKVTIHSDDAWLKKAGFENGDLIIAFGGTEFADETEMKALWAEGVKTGVSTVTLLRNGKRQTLNVKLQDLMAFGETGGRLWPSVR